MTQLSHINQIMHMLLEIINEKKEMPTKWWTTERWSTVKYIAIYELQENLYSACTYVSAN